MCLSRNYEGLIALLAIRPFTSCSLATLERIGVWSVGQQLSVMQRNLFWCRTIMMAFHFPGIVARVLEREDKLRSKGRSKIGLVGCHQVLACRMT